MTPAEMQKFVGDVRSMTNDELNIELKNLIEWEGEHGTAEPRIDEITMELLMREIIVPEDLVVGTELDEHEFKFIDAKPKEDSDGTTCGVPAHQKTE